MCVIVSRETWKGWRVMIIRIFKECDCIRYIEIDEEAALPLFNLILQSLDSDEEVVLLKGE
jgi:hypothetical protein